MRDWTWKTYRLVEHTGDWQWGPWFNYVVRVSDGRNRRSYNLAYNTEDHRFAGGTDLERIQSCQPWDEIEAAIIADAEEAAR